jgi:hypothetical protein
MAALERAVKVQEVILRALAKKISWWQAAEITGSPIDRCDGGSGATRSMAMRVAASATGEAQSQAGAASRGRAGVQAVLGRSISI